MRIGKLAGAAAVALGALTACGSLQGTAVFVGDERVSEATLDGFVDDSVSRSLDQGSTMAEIDYSQNREAAVLCVVLVELGEALDLEAADTGQAVSDLDEQCLLAQGYLTAIGQEVEPRELDEAQHAQLRDLGFGFEELPRENQVDLMNRAGLVAELQGYIDEYDVRVNPRYGVDSLNLSPEGLEGMFVVEIPQR
ncbi:hypothetical protein [Glycomyces halotolerans]